MNKNYFEMIGRSTLVFLLAVISITAKGEPLLNAEKINLNYDSSINYVLDDLTDNADYPQEDKVGFSINRLKLDFSIVRPEDEKIKLHGILNLLAEEENKNCQSKLSDDLYLLYRC